MTNHGDDCYFFYYSFCSKGDGCPFRHCEAAMGSETVCSLWEEGRCFRAACKFRHMEILKNRKEIPCYWEKQPAGCQKPHCAFFHEKPRFNEGVFIPSNKSVTWTEEHQQQQQEQEEEAGAPPPPASLLTTANPQLRSVIKTETQELVPSPTHPPVVINPADDDEDEDDQFSEEGEDGKLGPSPRKLHKPDDSLNIGASALEEIRLRRALKASMKRSGCPIQSAEALANGGKENIQSLIRPVLFESRDVPSLIFEENGRPRGSMAGRLGQKISTSDVNSGGLLKRSLAERLGRVVNVELPSEPQKALKPVKERLGLFSDRAVPAEPANTSEAPQKVPEQIHIKTLEEIKQEKASKTHLQTQSGPPLLSTPEITVTRTSSVKVPKENKRSVIVKDSSISHIKTFSEILQAKRKRQEEEQNQSPCPKKTGWTAESQKPSDTAAPPQQKVKGEVVRVKTLEEIRREKTARLQLQQSAEADCKKSSDSEEEAAKRPRGLRLQKLACQSKVSSEKTVEESVKPAKPAAAASETNTAIVTVKSFEEIMREKRMRKEQGEQTKGAADEESPQNRTPAAPLKRRHLALVTLSSAGSSTVLIPDSTQNVPVCKTALKSKSVSLLAAAPAAVASVPVKTNSSPQAVDTKSQSKNLRSSAQHRVAPQVAPTEAPDTTTSKKSVDIKVRPKLNVKPSVMKTSQKRKNAEHSAVAAVKPLNSSSTVQKTACTNTQVLPSLSASIQTQVSSAGSHSPSSLLDAGSASGPPREKSQPIPIFIKSHEGQPVSKEACAVNQSPVLKSPTQPKSRRLSTAAAHSTSSAATASSLAVDDFEDLINEFTDDHLEEDVDPGIGEDDLLQELSEMIDS
ncbi:unnamed protein product [Ophioblennius macclurei]